MSRSEAPTIELDIESDGKKLLMNSVKKVGLNDETIAWTTKKWVAVLCEEEDLK